MRFPLVAVALLSKRQGARLHHMEAVVNESRAALEERKTLAEVQVRGVASSTEGERDVSAEKWISRQNDGVDDEMHA